MQIELTKEQYRKLVELIHLGDWLANSCRTGKQIIKEYKTIKQYIYSFAKDFGMEKWIEYDQNAKDYFTIWPL